MNRNILPDQVDGMSYPDFIAFLGVDNSPPGGNDTIDEWMQVAHITRSSALLDLASSTASTARYIQARTSCRAVAIDRCFAAAREATRDVPVPTQPDPSGSLLAVVADAECLPIRTASISHITAGAVLGFFENPTAALDECHRVLSHRGLLCTAPFYYVDTPPPELLAALERVLGFRPNVGWTDEFWDHLHNSSFRLMSSIDHSLPVAARGEVAAACVLLMSSARGDVRVQPDVTKQAALRRLLFERLLFNEHRRFQRFKVQVWAKR